MTDRHKHQPITFRPPESDRQWLEDHAEATGLPLRRILALALAEYRERRDGVTAPARGATASSTPARKPAAKEPAPAKCAHRFVLKGWCKECREYVGQRQAKA